MTESNRMTLALLALAASVATSACGDDTTGDGSGGAGGASGGSGGGDSGGQSSGGQSAGGSSQGGAGPTGCTSDPTICPANMECCEGNPYPPDGQCYVECQLLSDRAIKHEVCAVDADAVLEQLASVPVSSWRYDSSPQDLHMGPMAQDFHAAFGLGDSARRIATVDASGVTMASIQALYHRVEALRRQSEEHEKQNDVLRAQIAALHARLEAQQ